MLFQLLDLPQEIIFEVLRRLESKDLLRCRLVCSSLRNLTKQSLELQYHVELAADGLVDGVDCALSTSERLTLLLQRRARWRYLDWSGIHRLKAPELCQAYELVGGVFALSKDNNNIFAPGSSHLALTWLPTRDTPAATIEREDLGMTIRDFAIDPSQDLMALVVSHGVDGFAIHLRTLSENKPHPRAKSQELRATVPFVGSSSFFQIADDVVSAFFGMHEPGLIIWNWHTGQILVEFVDTDMPRGAFDFAFISNRAFMLTIAAGPGSIELFTFADAEGSNLRPSVAKAAVFHLPPTKPGRDLNRAYTHAGAFVAHPMPGKPFETARDSRIHMFTLHYAAHGGIYFMFVHTRSFLSLIPASSVSTEERAPVVRAWEEWGPDHTRFVEWMGHFQWLRYIHGTRVIFPPMPQLFNSPESYMLLMDFNVHPKRLDDPVDDAPVPDDCEYHVIDKEREVVAENVFREPVVTRLPYAVSTRNVDDPVLGDYSGFMIDHEWLIGMRDKGDGTYVDLDVYTF